MTLELHARGAVLTDAVDELVRRVVDEHVEEIVVEDVIRALSLDLRLERDPIDEKLLDERLPVSGDEYRRVIEERERLSS